MPSFGTPCNGEWYEYSDNEVGRKKAHIAALPVVAGAAGAGVDIPSLYGYLGIHRAQLCPRVVPSCAVEDFVRTTRELGRYPAKHLDHRERSPAGISDWRGGWFYHWPDSWSVLLYRSDRGAVL